MATPDRAPRKTVAQMGVNVASGMPVPGVNAQTHTRKTASASDAGKARAAAHSPTGLTPGTVPNTKVNK